jgi:heptosyltransferase-2
METGGLEATVPVPARALHDARALLMARGWDGLAPLVGIAPGAAYGGAKRWPPERVAALVTRLQEERSATCVLVGSAGDVPAARAIESTLGKDGRAGVAGRSAGPIDLVGKTDLTTLLGILGHCAAFVSNDSGAMHLSAAAGVPVVAIFGPTDERATSPLGTHEILTRPVWCRPCHLRECPIDHRCMTRITVDEVADAVGRQLGRAARDGPAT